MKTTGGKALSNEREIVALLLEGCDNAEIAKRLEISESSVKAYFNRLFRRLGIRGGSKRIKLATLLYHKHCERWQQPNCADPANCGLEENVESALSAKGGKCDREERLVRLVHGGLNNREIAELAGVQEHVVKNYLRAIYDKLGLWSRLELALWYEKRRCEKCPRAALP